MLTNTILVNKSYQVSDLLRTIRNFYEATLKHLSVPTIKRVAPDDINQVTLEDKNSYQYSEWRTLAIKCCLKASEKVNIKLLVLYRSRFNKAGPLVMFTLNGQAYPGLLERKILQINRHNIGIGIGT